MRRGLVHTPGRALRHSLFVCGLSLLIALGASLAGLFVQQDSNTPSFTRAVASTPTEQRESTTSFGLLTRVVKEATDPRPPAPSAGTPEASTGAAAIETSAADPAPVDESTPVATPGPEATETSALTAVEPTPATPAVASVEAKSAGAVVSASRFQAPATTPTPVPTAPRATSAVSSTTGSAPASLAQVGDRVQATVTFYYCEDTTGGARPGDGGGFCGVMRDGSVVYPGAAACDAAYLGQQFRIEGDPTERVYTCADTGGGIHGEHRDIWFMGNAEGWAWQRVVGTSAVIEILR